MKMNPRVIYNQAQIYLKSCPGDEEPDDFEQLLKLNSQPLKQEGQKTLDALKIQKADDDLMDAHAYVWESNLSFKLPRERSQSVDV